LGDFASLRITEGTITSLVEKSLTKHLTRCNNCGIFEIPIYPDNVFLAGGSFGGFSVMSLITQYPKEFRAAANMFGITEMKAFVGSLPPMAQNYFNTELGFDPRKDETKNKAVSPFYKVDRIQIPLQIQQGAHDSRVPKSQSDIIVEKMKKLGKEVDYLWATSERIRAKVRRNVWLQACHCHG